MAKRRASVDGSNPGSAATVAAAAGATSGVTTPLRRASLSAYPAAAMASGSVMKVQIKPLNGFTYKLKPFGRPSQVGEGGSSPPPSSLSPVTPLTPSAVQMHCSEVPEVEKKQQPQLAAIEAKVQPIASKRAAPMGPASPEAGELAPSPSARLHGPWMRHLAYSSTPSPSPSPRPKASRSHQWQPPREAPHLDGQGGRKKARGIASWLHTVVHTKKTALVS